MMSLLLVVLSAAASDERPGEVAPPALLASAIAQALGPTHEKVALLAATDFDAEQLEAVRQAVGRTSLFTLVAREAASAVVTLQRDRDAVTATLEGEARRELARVAWAAPAAPASTDAEQRYQLVRRYLRERLRIRPPSPGYALSVPPIGFEATFARPAPVGPVFGFYGPAPLIAGHDWLIVRGTAEVLDDADLARLLGNERLVREIEDERYWPRLAWAIGFGSGAVAGITSGALLYDGDSRDRDTIAVSLITMGVASAALALLAPAMGSGHVLSPSEAERMVDEYDTSLRQRLGVSPDDLRLYGNGD